MSNYELFAKIGGDSSGLQRAMGNAQKSIGKTSDRFAKLRTAGLLAFKGLTVAATAAAGTLTALTVSGLRLVDNQAKLARSIGASIDGLKGLQIAAGDAGIEAGALGTAMQMMNARLAEAARGGNASAKAIERMGLDANELVGMDVDERIATMADQMLEMGFSAAQAQDELNQLGIRNRQLALLMIQGGDAIRAARQEVDDYGLSISSIEAGQVEAANDAFSRLGRLMEAIRIELAVQMAPIIKEVSDRFNTMAREGGGLRTVVRPAIEAVIQFIGVLGDALVGLQRRWLLFRQTINGVALGIANVSRAIKGETPEILDTLSELYREAATINDALTDLENRRLPSEILADLIAAANELKSTIADIPAEVGEDIKKAVINIDTFVKQAASNIQNAFAQFLFDPFEDGLKGMLASFANIIRQMIAQIMAANLLTAFFGQFAGQAGFMGQFASGLGLQAPTATPPPGLSTGGPMMARKPYLVGERGPELVVPSKSGYVVPNNKLGGGGGVSLSVNINAEDPGAEGRIRTMVERDLAPQIIQAAMGRTMANLTRPSFA